MIYFLVYRCFKICSNLIFFSNKIHQIKHIFCKKEYLKNFIDSCLKKFVKNIDVVKQKLPIVETKSHFSTPVLGALSLGTQTKLYAEGSKNVLKCCLVRKIFKSQKRLPSVFDFKD